jgi:hypothetical protein
LIRWFQKEDLISVIFISMIHPLQKPIDIFVEVKKLNFPSDQFMVVGSGIMAAKGIRDVHDLDIVVSQELFDACKLAGWELKQWTRPGRPGKEWLKKDNVDLMVEIQSKDEDYNLQNLKEDGELINGIWFLSIEQLIKFKKDYGRPKDFDDIVAMENYLAKHSV